MGDLSPHFSSRELACHHCGRIKINQRLLEGLEALRTLSGAPVSVNAGYRCQEHNLKVGGAAISRHVTGEAADIRIPGRNLQEMYELALRVPQFAAGGIGVYDGGFIHVDVRERSARWARVEGKYLGIGRLIRDVAV